MSLPPHRMPPPREQVSPDAPSSAWELTPNFAWAREFALGTAIGLFALAVLLVCQRFDPGFELIDDDAISSWQPIFTDFARQLSEGRMPVWSHHTSCGYPLLGWPQPSFVYPPMWLAHGICLAIGFDSGEFYVATSIHAVLAAAASFVYLRRFAVHPLAAATASLGAVFSGVLLGLGSCWPTYIFSAAYWPMTFLAIEELRSPQPRRFWTIALGLLGGLAFLYADLSLMVKYALIAVLYFVFRLDPPTARKSIVRALVASAVAVVVGLGQLAPSIELVASSARMGMGSNDFYTAPPRLWLGFVFPFAQLAWENHPFSLTRAAGGFFVGPCALLGALFAARWFGRLRGPHRALLLMTAIYLLLALGNAFPPNNLIQKFPVFSAMRWPFRWLFEGSLALALLSGFGLHLAFRDLAAGSGRLLVGGYALFAALTVAWGGPAPANWEFLATAMVGVWGIGLVAIGWFALRSAPRAFLISSCVWTGIAMIANVPIAQETRMARMTHLLDEPLDVGRNSMDRVLLLVRHSELVSAQREGNLCRLFPHRFETRSVLGYVYRPPSQGWMTGFELDGLIYENEPDLARRFLGPSTAILSTLRVGHVVVFKTNKVLAEACAANPHLKLESESAFYRIYRNEGFKDAAFLVRDLRRETGPDDWAEMGLRVAMPNTALVESSYDGPLRFGGKGSISGFREHHGDISFEVDADQEGFAVVTTTWFPRWRATIDGTPTPIVRANGSFMGIRVPAGKHAVRFAYVATDQIAMLAISAVALLAALAACIAFRREGTST